MLVLALTGLDNYYACMPLRMHSSYPVSTETFPNRGYEDVLTTLHRLNDRLGSVDVDNNLVARFVVIGGANLVLRGIKPTTPDIDLLASDEVFSVMK